MFSRREVISECSFTTRNLDILSLKALRGEVAEAIVREKFITEDSLQNYLKQAIPEFIRSSTQLRNTQTPWAQVSRSGTFAIRELDDEDEEFELPLSGLDLDFNDISYRHTEVVNVNKLPGFKKGYHSEPNSHSRSAMNFIYQLMEEPLNEEINAIYTRCKDILGYQQDQR